MNGIQPRCPIDHSTIHLVAQLNPQLQFVRGNLSSINWNSNYVGGTLDYEQTLLRGVLQYSIWSIFDYVDHILPKCDDECLPRELVLAPFRGVLCLRLAQVWHDSHPTTPVPEWLRMPLVDELVKQISKALKAWNFEAKLNKATKDLLTMLWTTLEALEQNHLPVETTLKGVAGWRIYWAWRSHSKSQLECMEIGWQYNLYQVRRQLAKGLPQTKTELPTHMRIAISAVIERCSWDEDLQKSIAKLTRYQKMQLARFWDSSWNKKAQGQVPSWLEP